jgi:hypothetical protein
MSKQERGFGNEGRNQGCVEDNHGEDVEDKKMDSYHDHDYCAVPGPAAVDLVLIEREEMQREIEDLRNKVEHLTGGKSFWAAVICGIRSRPSQGG